MHSFILVLCAVCFVVALAATPLDPDDIVAQGLYRQSDHVVVLGKKNFDKRIYGQSHAWLLQFYNSYCGHCRAFSPKFKTLALEILSWRKAVQLAAVDCSVEENNEICRQFEVMAYPSLRYLHENYVKGNANIGYKLQVTVDVDNLKEQLIRKMQSEQKAGRLQHIPSLDIQYYDSVTEVTPQGDTDYTFVIFENQNSTLGSELILDTNEYEKIYIKRVVDSSRLSELVDVHLSPALVVVDSAGKTTVITPNNPNKRMFLNALDNYLKSKDYNFPKFDIDTTNELIKNNSYKNLVTSDVVYYSDLEKTIKTSLHTEVVRFKVLEGEPLQALLDYLEVLANNFPFKANGKAFISDLRDRIAEKQQWKGADLYDLIQELEQSHAPVYSAELEYVACRGSESKYRGYTCGLWTLFHTLTVNAASKSGTQGPKVLSAMHGYVKNFFGCTECSKHFQAMAARNRIFDVKENDKAVLWLWISHNEVNLRLAGDSTEDPAFPKVQFPKAERCMECRLVRGAWNLPAVYQYLQQMYGADNIQDKQRNKYSNVAPSIFSNIDYGMISLLYIFSFIILILVIKLFLTKRFYRRSMYKREAWNKV